MSSGRFLSFEGNDPGRCQVSTSTVCERRTYAEFMHIFQKIRGARHKDFYLAPASSFTKIEMICVRHGTKVFISSRSSAST